VGQLVDFILHVDKHLGRLIQQFGENNVYWILIAIIFCETGLVVTPFLPGDSLLFAAGMLSSQGMLDPGKLALFLTIAAIVGDTVNYHIGKHFGERLFQNENSRIFKKSYLEKTHDFFEKHGGKTIVLARFVPIVRTFAPFVAGMGAMNYGKFLAYNIGGGIFWVNLCVWLGYFFGRIPAVEKNFHIAVFAIVFLSIVPVFLEMRKAKREERERALRIAEARVE
jgi:membrane-associated protein